VIHGTSLTVVHTQLVPLVPTAICGPLPPAAGAAALSGLTVNVHGDADPLWLTVCVWPAATMAPVRRLAPGFACTAKFTVPFPVPLAPASITIHGTSLTAVHAQVPAALTPNDRLAWPVAATAVVVALSVPVQVPPGAPAWVTVNVCPPAVIVPTRCAVERFAPTE
jgi:hypothetical protein